MNYNTPPATTAEKYDRKIAEAKAAGDMNKVKALVSMRKAELDKASAKDGMKFGEGGKTRRLTKLVRKSLGEDKAKRGTVAAKEYKAGQANRASGKSDETSKAKDVKIASAIQKSADEGKSRRAARITRLAYGESKEEKQKSSGNKRSGLQQKVKDMINRSASKGKSSKGGGKARIASSAKKGGVDFNKQRTKGRGKASKACRTYSAAFK